MTFLAKLQKGCVAEVQLLLDTGETFLQKVRRRKQPVDICFCANFTLSGHGSWSLAVTYFLEQRFGFEIESPK